MAAASSTNSTQSSDSHTLPFLPWGDTPLIPGTSLSASGLLVLADLSTIARRTVLTGTSSWFDAFVLAPGLHQQQHCEALSSTTSKLTGDSSSPPCTIKNTSTGIETEVTNTAMLGYLHRMVEGLRNARMKGGMGPSRGVTLQVGKPIATPSTSTQSILSAVGLNAARRVFNRARENGVLRTILAPLLYAIAPILTALSMSLMLATRDWWGVGILCALMIARVLNIWVIKKRTSQEIKKSRVPNSHCGIVCSLKNHHDASNIPLAAKAPPASLPPPNTLEPTSVDNMTFDGRAAVDGPGSVSGPSIPSISKKPSAFHIEQLATILPTLDKSSIPTSYLLNLPNSRTPIKIEGVASDMEALLSGAWMREKTNVEGYMEAMSKILVYGVAAVSGNMKQTGNIILGGLLVVSAATLALANSERAYPGAEDGFAGKIFRIDGDLDGDGKLSEDEKAGLSAREKRMEGSAV